MGRSRSFTVIATCVAIIVLSILDSISDIQNGHRAGPMYMIPIALLACALLVTADFSATRDGVAGRFKAVAVAFAVMVPAVLLDMATYILTQEAYAPMLAGVTAAALLGGYESGAESTALAVMAKLYFFVEPRFSFRVETAGALLKLLTFAMSAAAVTLLAGHLRRERLRLRNTIAHLRRLEGILSICAGCRRIRDEHGKWVPIESYISARSEARFSHGMCADCMALYYGDYEAARPEEP